MSRVHISEDFAEYVEGSIYRFCDAFITCRDNKTRRIHFDNLTRAIRIAQRAGIPYKIPVEIEAELILEGKL